MSINKEKQMKTHCSHCGSRRLDSKLESYECGRINKTRTTICVAMEQAMVMQIEIERLRAALKLIAAPKRSDGTYNRCREACETLAREALGPTE